MTVSQRRSTGGPVGPVFSRRNLVGMAAVAASGLLVGCSDKGGGSAGSSTSAAATAAYSYVEKGNEPLVVVKPAKVDGKTEEPLAGVSLTIPTGAGELTPIGDTTSTAFVYKSATDFSAIQVMVEHPQFDDFTTPEWWARWEWSDLMGDKKAQKVSGMVAIDWPGAKDGKAFTWTWTQYLDASLLDSSASGTVTMDAAAFMVATGAGEGLHMMAGAPTGTLPGSVGIKAIQSVKLS